MHRPSETPQPKGYAHHVRAQRTVTVLAQLPERLGALTRMTHDLASLFDWRVVALFREIDPHGIDVVGLDPLALLSTLDEARIQQLAADDAFVTRADALARTLDAERDRPRWFALRSTSPLRSVAYLSPEFGIAASVPQYSGGLGILAGDHLKAANDLGVPLVGIGLFYRRGYFQQSLDRANRQNVRFATQQPESVALSAVADHPVIVPVGGVDIRARVWKATVGTIPLYLLDTEVDDPSGTRTDQLMTDRLYGGQSEDRIRQEMLLGVGGHRLLASLGLTPDVHHLNEGHAGFLLLEAIRVTMRGRGVSFAEAIEIVRPSIAFTTHTPVPAGIDRFHRSLIEKYLGWWCADCGVSVDELMTIGADPDGEPDMFNLAAMSLRLAGSANGVSRLHGAVSRTMFAPLWEGTPTEEVPIGSVTNGVHAATWTSSEMSSLLARAMGPDWPERDAAAWGDGSVLDDRALWSIRNASRAHLVEFVRERTRRSAIGRGDRNSEIAWCDSLLDPEVLTIGFARRFATYKRATLLLRDAERFRRLLSSSDLPVQFVFAGKAHPADEPGKAYIQQVAAFASSPELRDRVVFVENYDIDVGRALTQGVDLWLNTPLRPMEACGTSGMKAAMNGALNCSVLDGWWDELYRPELGWAIPTDDGDDPERRDDAESRWLFDLLERHVVPAFYDRDDDGLPMAWLGRIRASLSGLVPEVSAARMVRDYVTEVYEPAAARVAVVTADDASFARGLAATRLRLSQAWPEVRITQVEWPWTDTVVGHESSVEIHVTTAGLDPSDLDAQMVSGPVRLDGSLVEPRVTSLTFDRQNGDVAVFRGTIVCDRTGELGLAARVVPRHPGARSWTDFRMIRWADED